MANFDAVTQTAENLDLYVQQRSAFIGGGPNGKGGPHTLMQQWAKSLVSKEIDKIHAVIDRYGTAGTPENLKSLLSLKSEFSFIADSTPSARDAAKKAVLKYSSFFKPLRPITRAWGLI